MIPSYDISTDSFKLSPAPSITQPLLSVCIRVSLRCNIICSYCMVDSSPMAREPDAVTVLSVLATLGQKGPLRIVWSGGEPFQYPHFRKCLGASRSGGHVNIVSSHGLLPLRPDDTELTDWFHISCPSTDENVYRSLRPSGNAHEALRTIERLAGENRAVTGVLLLCNTTRASAAQTARDMVTAGVRKLYVTNLRLSGRAVMSGLKPISDKSILDFKEELLPYLKQHDIAVTWPAIRKAEVIEKAYVVITGHGDVEEPDALRPLNVTTDGAAFWRHAATMSIDHWRIFTEQGH